MYEVHTLKDEAALGQFIDGLGVGVEIINVVTKGLQFTITIKNP